MKNKTPKHMDNTLKLNFRYIKIEIINVINSIINIDIFLKKF